MKEHKKNLKLPVFAAGIVMVFLIGYIDHLTAATIDISIFYLVPVAFTVWFSKRKLALTVSLLAVAVWEFEELFFRIENSRSPDFWINSVLRLAYFLTAVIIISKLKNNYDTEKRLASYDSLTGAINRRYFEKLVSEEMKICAKEKKPYTIIYFDIDNFKKLNDTRGHAFGDAVLVKTSSVICGKVYDKGYFARLGGDEFAFFLPGFGRKESAAFMDEIIKELGSRENELKGVTYSFGVLAVEKKRPENMQKLMHIADKLMYTVKKNGKNSYRIKTI